MHPLKLVNVVSFADETMASFRLRQLVIAEHINATSDEWRVVISEKVDPKADINLFHKHLNPEYVRTLAIDLRQNSQTKIVFDISDNYFDDPHLRTFYIEMCNLSDLVTVSSKALRDLVVKETGKGLSTVIEINEPTQLEWVTEEQRNNRERKGKYVWLGHKSNLQTLVPHIEKYGKDLTIISNKEVKGVNFIPWSIGVEKHLLDYDTILLPQENPYKSPNRFVDAKFAGCNIETFGAKCYEDVEKNFSFEHYTLKFIAEEWVEAFKLVDQRPRLSPLSLLETPRHKVLEGKKFIRLNVGCGVKIYPKKEGWVNIDLIDHPDLDLKHDVRKISQVLGKEVADELHAYHVVEHIYPQELQAVLRDWYLVLKPGGKIIIEMPDFLKAAKNILQLETTSDPNLWLDLGLKAFYGDYDPFKPNVMLDLHKWLWTFKTFEPELTKAGFIGMEEQTPVTHRKERDFRIIGYKN